jgi:hypothetical protein
MSSPAASTPAVTRNRRLAASVVSGYRFRACHPNPITNPPPSDCGTSGSDTASHIGLYEIPLPPGNYTIEVESINPQFTSGSSLGPSDFPIPLPVAPPAPIGPYHRDGRPDQLGQRRDAHRHASAL